MTKPVAPSAMRPRKRLTIFPRTCAAIRAMARRHPRGIGGTSRQLTLKV